MISSDASLKDAVEVVRCTGQKTLRIIVQIQSPSGQKIITSTPIKVRILNFNQITFQKCRETHNTLILIQKKLSERSDDGYNLSLTSGTKETSYGLSSPGLFVAAGGTLALAALAVLGFSLLRSK